MATRDNTINIYLRGDTWHVDVLHNDKRYRSTLRTKSKEIAVQKAKAYKARITGLYYSIEAIPNEYITKMYCAARGRSVKKGVEFKLTREELTALFDRAQGACELTGLPFTFTKDDINTKRPFAPSIDRINTHGIYEFKNCRIVCLAVNIGVNEWGLAVFEKVAKAFINSHTNVPMVSQYMPESHCQ